MATFVPYDFFGMLVQDLTNLTNSDDLFGIPGHTPREMEVVEIPQWLHDGCGYCEPSKPPMPSLVIEPFGRFNPRPDMTPVESAHLAVLLAHYGYVQQYDFQSYVRAHGLQRHFGSLPHD